MRDTSLFSAFVISSVSTGRMVGVISFSSGERYSRISGMMRQPSMYLSALLYFNCVISSRLFTRRRCNYLSFDTNHRSR